MAETGRVSQAAVRVLAEGDDPEARVSEAAILVLAGLASPGQVAQAAILVLARVKRNRTVGNSY